jgi:hypothetical protein
VSGTLKIYHPKSGETVQCAKSPGFFAAFGEAAPGAPQLTGALKDATGQQIGSAHTLAQQPHWVIAFTDVPPGGSYQLEVKDPSGTVLEKSEGVNVRVIRALTITYPANSAQVCPTFSSYGTTDSPGSLGGFLLKGTVRTPGNTLQGGPDWVVQFVKVAKDTYDKLTVMSGPSADSRTNIQVIAC